MVGPHLTFGGPPFPSEKLLLSCLSMENQQLTIPSPQHIPKAVIREILFSFVSTWHSSRQNHGWLMPVYCNQL